ncbi:EF-hand domain-containing protein [Rhabdochromatium marinum]|uniref:EF-hand domain-containing protein n=1 Tax=Rhabdochromatium marinum TaxID=48729 RepID=UPI0019039181|nr:EF-hand domain-containing protein [Rhabdochromatium marinum]MBK1649179.1 hypothetical protein [Rhabdochromatium marinum]
MFTINAFSPSRSAVALMRIALLFSVSAMASAQMGAAVGAATAAGVAGVSGAMRMMPAFTDFDSDGNGQVSPSEFEQTRAQRIAERSQQGYQMRGLANAPSFSDLDTNGDGVLDKDEFSTGVAAQHQAPTP